MVEFFPSIEFFSTSEHIQVLSMSAA